MIAPYNYHYHNALFFGGRGGGKLDHHRALYLEEGLVPTLARKPQAGLTSITNNLQTNRPAALVPFKGSNPSGEDAD